MKKINLNLIVDSLFIFALIISLSAILMFKGCGSHLNQPIPKYKIA